MKMAPYWVNFQAISQYFCPTAVGFLTVCFISTILSGVFVMISFKISVLVSLWKTIIMEMRKEIQCVFYRLERAHLIRKLIMSPYRQQTSRIVSSSTFLNFLRVVYI